MTRDADILVAGGGMAGLSLAVRLAPTGRRVTVIEPRETYGRDRTWCFWSAAPHAFSPLVRHRWPRWRLVGEAREEGGGRAAGEAREVVREAAPFAYECLPADAFYAHARGVLARHPNVELRLGEAVRAVHPSTRQVVVETADHTYAGRWLFDSRPPDLAAAAAHAPVFLYQQFLGHTVRAPRPAFTPDTATLMDLRLDQGAGVHFVYVLPFSREEALVEVTRFAERPAPEAELAATLAGYLARHGLADAERLDVERGLLPMTTAPLVATRAPRVTPIGLRGGAARPATGYAFQNAQRDAERLATAFAPGAATDPLATGALAERPSPRLLALDHVFLSQLARDPGAGPGLFLDLFERAPAASVVRFLSGDPSARDVLAVMRALPAGTLLAETLRVYASRPGLALAAPRLLRR